MRGDQGNQKQSTSSVLSEPMENSQTISNSDQQTDLLVKI